jgi:hypothetical protein
LFDSVKFSGFKRDDSATREAESVFYLTEGLAASDSFNGFGAARFLDTVTVGNAGWHGRVSTAWRKEVQAINLTVNLASLSVRHGLVLSMRYSKAG